MTKENFKRTYYLLEFVQCNCGIRLTQNSINFLLNNSGSFKFKNVVPFKVGYLQKQI